MGDKGEKQTSRKKSNKAINSFSGFRSAFETSARNQIPEDVPGSSQIRARRATVGPSDVKQKRNVGPSRADRPSAIDVIVLDSSDIEEAVPVKKRQRTSTSSKMVAVEISSSDEQQMTTKRKAKGKSGVTISKSESFCNHDSPISSALEQSMWCEAYAPTSTVDLAPSKTRVQSVRNWLEEALYGRPGSVDSDIPFSKLARDRIRKYRRILVLSGPAGVGKTTTLKVVAKELNVEVVEWEEGAEEWSLAGQIDKESMNSKFVGFLSRNAYNPLALANTAPTPSTSQHINIPAVSQPRILLLTSLPNLSHLPTRQTFHQALMDYTKSFTSTSCPLVIVVPDAGNSGAAEESWIGADSSGDGAWDLRSVIGKDLVENPAVRIIEFLPMAPTFLVKALKRISTLAFPDTKSRPSQDSIQLIAHTANGDLRSAINSLQFLSRNGEQGHGLNTKGANPRIKASGKGSRGGKGAKINTSNEVKALLNAVARREQSLGLFHALGKVLYNKRIGDATEDGTVDAEALENEENYAQAHPLPPHLASHERRRCENDLDALIASVPVDTATFTLWIHQNLPSFCSDVEEVEEAYDDICRADLMRADDDLWQRSQHAIAYAFHVAVRGALNGLPTPVPKNHQKIVKPQFFEYLRMRRGRQESVTAAGKWLVAQNVARQGLLTVEETQDDSASSGRWGGQLSQSVLATEIMPCLRLLKKTGAQIPSTVMPEGEEAFMSFEDDDFKLEVLDERDEVPFNEISENELLDNTLDRDSRSRFSTQSKALPIDEESFEPSTWLAEDDIDED